MAKVQQQVRVQPINPFQTQAPTDRVSEDAAIRANQSRFAEQERKRKEQQALRDKSIELQSMGLPKQWQGQISSSVDELLSKVRKGEIDPNSYEFRNQLSKINAKAQMASAMAAELPQFLGSGKQIITFDEDGNPYDIKSQANQYITSPYEMDYEGGDAIGEFVPEYRDFTARMTAPIDVDTERMDDFIKQVNTMTADEVTELFRDKFNYVREQKTEQMTPNERAMLKNALIDEHKSSLASEYARQGSKAGTGIPFSEWSDRYVSQRLPQSKVTETTKANLQAKDERDTGRGLDASISKPAPADINGKPALATTINVDEDMPIGDTGLGRPRRLYYSPRTNTYQLEYVAYEKVKDEGKSTEELLLMAAAPEIAEFINSEGKKEYYRLDKSKPVKKQIEKGDLDWNALVSTISKTTKAQAADVTKRLESLSNYDIKVGESGANQNLGKKLEVVPKGEQEEVEITEDFWTK